MRRTPSSMGPGTVATRVLSDAGTFEVQPSVRVKNYVFPGAPRRHRLSMLGPGGCHAVLIRISMCRDWCTWGLGVTCHHAPVDDGRDCNLDGTTGTCLDGLCGAEHLCDGVLCDDDNLCTDDECGWDGSCVFAPAVSCSDGNPCTEDECDPADGTCYYVDKPNGTYCSWWFTSGTCEDGQCRTE